ncbi:MAG: alkaline phosphatase family protein [Solirubrobacterales bacterium]
MATAIATFSDRDRGKEAAAAVVSAAGADAAATAHPAEAAAQGATGADSATKGLAAWITTPRAAAAAVICMLGLGVVVGSASSQIAHSAGVETIVLEMAEEEKAPPPEEEPVEVAPAPPEEEVAAAPVAEAPVAAPLPEALPEEAPAEPLPEEPPEEELVPFDPEEEVEETLPEVKHLFLIVLGENGFDEAFGETSPAPYLQKTLPEQGELLTNYYGVTRGQLANQAALLSGQGPTEELAAECPVEPEACLFPATVETVVGQLAEKELKWRAYVEEAVPGTPEPPSCARPFGLFHSLLDDPKCPENVVGLPQLATDLRDPTKAPTFAYVVPNRCHAGAVEPCEEGQPSGPLAAEPFLREAVPKIVNSKAYADGGLLMITSAQAPQTGTTPDASSCCATPAYPNLPPPPEEVPGEGGVKQSGGGGRVGLLLLSSFVEPGTVDATTYANHFTLLATIEELFELERLGYAAEPAMVPLEPSVFNAGAEEESTSVSEEEATMPQAAKRPQPFRPAALAPPMAGKTLAAR